MNEHSNPIEFLLEFAWANGADRFVVNNAKDELKKLKDKNKEMATVAFQANTFAIEETNRWLSCEKELTKLKEEYNKLLNIFNHPVAYGKINDRNDLYDVRILNNPHEDQSKIVPLYSNREEFLSGDWKGYNNYGKFTN